MATIVGILFSGASVILCTFRHPSSLLGITCEALLTRNKATEPALRFTLWVMTPRVRTNHDS